MSSHIHHIHKVFSLWVLMCLFRVLAWLNLWFSQMCSLSHVCIYIAWYFFTGIWFHSCVFSHCVVRFPASLNIFILHNVHMYGLSPVKLDAFSNRCYMWIYSHKCHRHMVSPLCAFSCVLLFFLLHQTPYCTMCICMVSLLCAFSCALSGLHDWTPCHMLYTYKVYLLCAFSCALSGCLLDWTTYRMVYTCMVSLLCAFSYD